MRYLFSSIILCGFLELWYGIRQCFDVMSGVYPYGWVQGTFDNSGPFSVFVVMILPLAWYYMLARKSIKRENWDIFQRVLVIISSLYVVIACVVLIFSMSRTSWLAACVGCGVVSCIYYNFDKQRHWNFKRMGLYIVITSMILLFLSVGVYRVKKDSADGRLLIWKVSSHVIKEHLMFGVGKGKFAGVYGEAQENYFREGRGTKFEEYIAGAPNYAYNEYIQIAVEYGLCGLIIFIGLILYAFYNIMHSRISEIIPITGAFISLLTVAFFSYPFRDLYTCLLSVVIIVVILFFPYWEKRNEGDISNYILGISLFVCIIYIVCCSFGQKSNIKIAKKQWTTLQQYFNEGRYQDIVQNYMVLYPYLKSEAAFLFEYGQCLSKIEQYQESNNVLQEGIVRSSDPMFFNIMGKNYWQLGQLQLAEKMFYKAYFRVPHRLYSLYLLMLLYEEQHRIEEMLIIARQIVTKEVKVNSPVVERIKDDAIMRIKNSKISLTND